MADVGIIAPNFEDDGCWKARKTTFNLPAFGRNNFFKKTLKEWLPLWDLRVGSVARAHVPSEPV